MNISGASLPTMNSSESAEVLSASLAKRQQQADGKAAIALIESARLALAKRKLIGVTPTC